MKRSRTARALYLAALLQLVGGPVILCGIMLLARLTASHAVTMGWAQGFHAACESHEMAAIAEDLNPGIKDGGGKTRPSAPGKVKNGVGKLLLAGETAPQLWIFGMDQPIPPHHAADMISKRAHAPPVPPPRFV